MKSIDSYNEYCDIVAQTKQKYKSSVTNCLLSIDDINRLSGQHRIFYEESEGGILLYVDEMKHFLFYYFWNLDYPLIMSRREKSIVTRIIYSEPKRETQIKIEQMLIQCGFEFGDNLRQAVKVRNTDDDPKLSLSRRLFEGSGLSLVNAKEEHVQEIREMMTVDDTMHNYEIPYLTDQEMIELGQEGRFVCVVDKSNTVVAFRGSSSSNTSNGYMRIREDYRVNYGIAMILLDYSDKYASKRGQKIINWIDERNTSSARLHIDMGREWGDRYMEYLVLNGR